MVLVRYPFHFVLLTLNIYDFFSSSGVDGVSGDKKKSGKSTDTAKNAKVGNGDPTTKATKSSRE